MLQDLSQNFAKIFSNKKYLVKHYRSYCNQKIFQWEYFSWNICFGTYENSWIYNKKWMFSNFLSMCFELRGEIVLHEKTWTSTITSKHFILAGQNCIKNKRSGYLSFYNTSRKNKISSIDLNNQNETIQLSDIYCREE